MLCDSEQLEDFFETNNIFKPVHSVNNLLFTGKGNLIGNFNEHSEKNRSQENICFINLLDLPVPDKLSY